MSGLQSAASWTVVVCWTLLSLTSVLAQRPAFGRCPQVQAKEDFDLDKDDILGSKSKNKCHKVEGKAVQKRRPKWREKLMAEPALLMFTGEWTEVERSFYLFESATTCTKLNFTSYQNDTMQVELHYNLPWRRGTSSVSQYRVNDVSSKPGVFEMVLVSRLPELVARLAPGSGSYTVLETNYTDFALIYSCTDLRLLHADFIWVLGRTSDISVDARTIVYSTLDKLKINRDRLLLTPNRDCKP